MTYKTEDGEVLTGTSAEEIVTALRDGGRFTADQSLPDFMAGMADRCKEWNGAQVRSDSYENFVTDLTGNNFLIEQPE